MKKPDVLEKLKHHFQEEHGLRGEEGETSHEVSPISQTIDKLRSRIKASFSYFKIECGVTKVFTQWCGYRVKFGPYLGTLWIQIRFLNEDPDPHG